MTKARYLSMKKWFSDHTQALRLLSILYRLVPIVILIIYPLFAVYKYFTSGIDRLFIRYLLVPFSVLIAVTVLRKILNKPRPYEVFETTSVIKKAKKGYSFPSKHTACAFIIALAILSVNVPAGIVMLFLALTVAVTRVLAGVHFVHDVTAAAVISTVIGVVFFFIL